MLKKVLFALCTAVFLMAAAACEKSPETPPPANGAVDTQPAPGTEMEKSTDDETP